MYLKSVRFDQKVLQNNFQLDKNFETVQRKSLKLGLSNL